MSLGGVYLLFRFGLPFALPMNGAVILVTGEVDRTQIALQSLYEELGYAGLFLIVAGTVCQAVASYLDR